MATASPTKIGTKHRHSDNDRAPDRHRQRIVQHDAIEVPIASVGDRLRSSSIGTDTTVSVTATTAKQRPVSSPITSICQPADVKSVARSNSPIDVGCCVRPTVRSKITAATISHCTKSVRATA